MSYKHDFLSTTLKKQGSTYNINFTRGLMESHERKKAQIKLIRINTTYVFENVTIIIQNYPFIIPIHS